MICRPMKRLRLGVLGSGKGSNFSAILRAIRAGGLDAEVVVVGSDVADAGILRIGADAGIPTFAVSEPTFRTRLSPEVEAGLAERLAGVDLVVLAGYMRVIKAPLLEAFPRRIVNVHPSLLPAFRGLAAWRQALEAGVEVAGCTVHYVDDGVDTGEVLGQTEVPVLADDTPESLHARIQVAEHALYPAVLRRIGEEWA